MQPVLTSMWPFSETNSGALPSTSSSLQKPVRRPARPPQMTRPPQPSLLTVPERSISPLPERIERSSGAPWGSTASRLGNTSSSVSDALGVGVYGARGRAGHNMINVVGIDSVTGSEDRLFPRGSPRSCTDTCPSASSLPSSKASLGQLGIGLWEALGRPTRMGSPEGVSLSPTPWDPYSRDAAAVDMQPPGSTRRRPLSPRQWQAQQALCSALVPSPMSMSTATNTRQNSLYGDQSRNIHEVSTATNTRQNSLYGDQSRNSHEVRRKSVGTQAQMDVGGLDWDCQELDEPDSEQPTTAASVGTPSHSVTSDPEHVERDFPVLEEAELRNAWSRLDTINANWTARHR